MSKLIGFLLLTSLFSNVLYGHGLLNEEVTVSLKALTHFHDEMPDVVASELKLHREQYIVVDVRQPEEIKEDGMIPGSVVATLGNPLLKYLAKADQSKRYVFVCSSGVRGTFSAVTAKLAGFEDVHVLRFGYFGWLMNEYNQPPK